MSGIMRNFLTTQRELSTKGLSKTIAPGRAERKCIMTKIMANISRRAAIIVLALTLASAMALSSVTTAFADTPVTVNLYRAGTYGTNQQAPSHGQYALAGADLTATTLTIYTVPIVDYPYNGETYDGYIEAFIINNIAGSPFDSDSDGTDDAFEFSLSSIGGVTSGVVLNAGFVITLDGLDGVHPGGNPALADLVVTY
jgi:hypothetical protein